MRSPKVVMLDEPSLGLAPIVIDEVFDVLLTLKKRGAAILLVEQLVERAHDIADHAYAMISGRIAGDGPTAHCAAGIWSAGPMPAADPRPRASPLGLPR
ncbi:hypothetical protein [Arvimicrobium flavum]|uniref:hypothetical protein n=1 Tax=Arvimicrobium flavum TaxID=3393320 RepID=UPI00237A1E47|nr:hypothetical protein [Mesorhizobium shangrilense]